MSLKQEEVIRILPENNFNVSRSMRKAGYTEQGSRAGTNYEALRKKIAKYYNPEEFKAKILKYEKKFIKDGDNSNLMANLTLQAKILGLTKDNNSQQVMLNINDTLDKLKQPKPIDAISSESDTYNNTEPKLT